MARTAPAISATVGPRTASAVRKRGHAHLADVAAHDRAERACGLSGGEPFARCDAFQERGEVLRVAHAWPARAREPAGSSAAGRGRSRDAMLSGWNCTPCTGWVLCMTPMITPSSVRRGDFERGRHAVRCDRQRVIARREEIVFEAAETRFCRCGGCARAYRASARARARSVPP